LSIDELSLASLRMRRLFDSDCPEVIVSLGSGSSNGNKLNIHA
jgi:hypothetical protein